MPKFKRKPLPTVPNRYLTIDGPYSRRRRPLKEWPITLVPLALVVTGLIAVRVFFVYWG